MKLFVIGNSGDVQKPLVDLNDLFKYNTNTNKATRGEGTMFTHPLNLEQFD
jgi:hypothetical protein